MDADEQVNELKAKLAAAESKLSAVRKERDEFAETIYGSFIGGERYQPDCQHCHVDVDLMKWTTTVHLPDCIVNKAKPIADRALQDTPEARSPETQTDATDHRPSSPEASVRSLPDAPATTKEQK